LNPRSILDVVGHETTRLLLLGVAVGALGGIAAVVFHLAVTGFGELAFGTPDPSIGGAAWWRVVLFPTLGGLGAGSFVWLAARKRRPNGVPDIIEAASTGGGHLSLRDSSATAVGASLALGFGLSGGREAPLSQLGAALASKLGRTLHLPASRVRILAAAGASAGIAAAFNTPIAAVFFGLEVILGTFAVDMFGVVVAATVSGTVVGQALLGDRVALVVPAFEFGSAWELVGYAGLGVLVGLASALSLRVLGWTARLAERHPARPWLRGGAAGLVTGLVAALGLRGTLGSGYGFVERLLAEPERVGPLLLVLLVCAKIGTASLSQRSGTGVGLFSPTVFVGAVSGTLVGGSLAVLAPALVSSPASYGLVGIGAAIAAVTQAPATAVLMLFEMTHDYQVILPTLIALTTATVVARALGSRSVYDQLLAERGVELERGLESLVMYDLVASDVMRADVLRVSPQESTGYVASLFLDRRINQAYVIDEGDRFHGVINIQDVKELIAGHGEGLSLADLEQTGCRCVPPDRPLADCMSDFFIAGADELPVVDAEGRFRGALYDRDIVGAYHREVLRKEGLLARMEGGPSEDRRVDFVQLPDGEVVDSVRVDGRLAGRSLADLELPSRFGVTVLAVNEFDLSSRDHHRRHVDCCRPLLAGDRLIVVGPADGVDELRRLCPRTVPTGEFPALRR
jgi:CIC family chloride channel protein